MRFKIKYQTRGKVESYIAMATSLVATLSMSLVDEFERLNILQIIEDEVFNLAKKSTKGIIANPTCEIDDITMSLSVCNTAGREVLLVYFERVFEKGQHRQVTKL